MMMENEELMMRLNELRYGAMHQDSSSGTKGTYEWELGVMIIHQITTFSGVITDYHSDEKIMLMGIPVRLNYEKPYLIKLWKEVNT